MRRSRGPRFPSGGGRFLSCGGRFLSRGGRVPRRWWRLPVVLLVTAAAAGCLSIGPKILTADQVDYGRALGEAKKREILALIVGLRYADAPAFLTVTQVIAGYTFNGGLTPFAGSLPNPAGPATSITGMGSYSNHPTFTFTPTTGDSFAKAYIHPLAPAVVLPLADSGIPIDLLLRIAVQSMGGLNNAAMLGGPTGNGSPGYFELLAALRRLQLAGELTVVSSPQGGNEGVSLTLGLARGTESADAAADLRHVRELLHLPAGTRTYAIVDGHTPAAEPNIPIVTRSILAILSDLGAEIGVPQSDVARGATQESLQLVGGETRPVLVVHGGAVTGPVYAAVTYHGTQFWIDDADFDSKYAVTVVQDLMALAEVTDASHSPVVTVPAN